MSKLENTYKIKKNKQEIDLSIQPKRAIPFEPYRVFIGNDADVTRYNKHSKSAASLIDIN